jgi:hypothetical protein
MATENKEKVDAGMCGAVLACISCTSKPKEKKPAQVVAFTTSDLLPVFYGLFLLYFGVKHPTITLVVEVFLITAYATTVEMCGEISKDFFDIIKNLRVVEKEVEGNVRAHNGNWTWEDTANILHALAKINMAPFVSIVKDANIMFMVLCGCLKVNMAKSVALAASISNTIEPTVKYYLTELLEPLVPSNVWDSLSILLTGGIYATVLFYAFTCSKLLVTYQAIVKGSSLISEGIYKFFIKELKLDPVVAKLVCDSITGLIIAGALAGYFVAPASTISLSVTDFYRPIIMAENLLLGHTAKIN